MVPTLTLNVQRLKDVVDRKIKVATVNRQLAARKLSVLNKFDYQCASCGSREELTIDHIYPFSLIKRDRLLKGQKVSNIKLRYNKEYLDSAQILCVKCHAKKDFPKQEEKR